MKIVKPKGRLPKGSELVVYGKDQPKYLPLPAIRHNDSQGTVTSCWKLSIIERLKVLFTGRIYLDLLTFNDSIQPQLLSTKLNHK